MKKTDLLLLFIAAILTSKAQDIQPIKNSTYFESEFFFNDPWLTQLNSEGKKIKEITYTSSKYPQDHNYTLLNSIGQVTERKYTNRWGISVFMFKNFIHRKNQYENGELAKVEFFNEKQKQKSYYIYEYAMSHKLKHSQSFKNGKKTSETYTEYNSDSTQKEYRSYKIKNAQQKLNLKYEYEYYEDKQKKETRQYNGKGKLKYTWKYDCNPKGEVVKQESQVCKNTGFNNKGYIVDVIFHTNAKGRKTKYIHTYYMFNGKIIHVSNENYIIKKGKEIKLSDVHIADSIEPYYCYRNYDKKGNITMENKIEYSTYLSHKRLLKRSVYSLQSNGNITFRWETQYNDKGLPMITESFNKKNKIIGKAIYTYKGDDSYIVNHYNKKQKLIEALSGKVSYF